MSSKTILIGLVEVQRDAPTELSFSDLPDWVIWQFPSPHSGWLDAAAHPSIAGHGWIPARVQPLKQRVLLYANLGEPLRSPEEAAKRMAHSLDSQPPAL